MKRVKVMLLAIAVVALAAGTLAFKARYTINYCTTFATTTLVGGQQIYTCTFIRPDGIQVTLSCPAHTLSKTTAINAPTITVCTTAPTLDVEGDPSCVNRICTTATTKLTVE